MALVMTKPSDSSSLGPNKFHNHQKTRTDRVDVNALLCRPADEPVEVPLSFRGTTRGYDIMIAVPPRMSFISQSLWLHAAGQHTLPRSHHSIKYTATTGRFVEFPTVAYFAGVVESVHHNLPQTAHVNLF